jgi:glucokinase
LAQFGRDVGTELPRAAAFGIAAPIEGEVLRFVNSSWAIDRHGIAAELGLDQLLLLNDFGRSLMPSPRSRRTPYPRSAAPPPGCRRRGSPA